MRMETLPVAELPRLRTAKRHAGERKVEFHSHDLVEFVLVRRGRLWIDVADLTLEGRPDDLYILPGRVPHNQRNAGPWTTVCLLFLHGARLLDPSPRVVDLRGEPCMCRWLEDLCALHAVQRDLADPVCDALLLAVLTRLAELENQRRAAAALHPRVAQALRFLQTHLTEEFDAATLAGAACASYSHLCALFRAQFGCGPMQYQRKLRMDLARRLLLDPYLSMSEVARQCGYEDDNYFVRLFRLTHGLPPGAWRKRLVKKL